MIQTKNTHQNRPCQWLDNSLGLPLTTVALLPELKVKSYRTAKKVNFPWEFCLNGDIGLTDVAGFTPNLLPSMGKTMCSTILDFAPPLPIFR
jgi:hypothetical protein